QQVPDRAAELGLPEDLIIQAVGYYLAAIRAADDLVGAIPVQVADRQRRDAAGDALGFCPGYTPAGLPKLQPRFVGGLRRLWIGRVKVRRHDKRDTLFVVR